MVSTEPKSSLSRRRMSVVVGVDTTRQRCPSTKGRSPCGGAYRQETGRYFLADSSTLHRLLRDPYYLGLVPYKPGTPDAQIFPGRHEALTDEETYEAVQALLDEHRVSVERSQKHQHYLKGSVFCGECGRRLLFWPSRSKSGRHYEYFFCGSRMRGGGCTMRRNISPHLIENAIARYYK